MKIRLVELFAGIGAFSAAFRNTKIPYETVAIAEIDPHAIRAYASIHGDVPNLGDISLVENLPECDLLTYSFPCQDISLAGRGRGFAKSDNTSEQTRSGLLWEVERLLLKSENKPKYLIMENVDAILNSNHIRNFRLWVRALTGMGYTSSYAVLDASDYGVPQTRKRCFMVSALGDERFVFPPPAPDGRVLADVLEENVDDKYFLPAKRLENLEIHKPPPKAKGLIIRGDLHRKYTMTNKVYSIGGVSPCMTTKRGRTNIAVESLSVRTANS
jgi:DNA (cytosine-5)-methyltransferase 1